MFAEERLEEILKLLEVEGKVVVKDLSLRFKVTEDCIRKDLKNLEGKKLLKRTYGGAVPVRETAKIQSIEIRMNSDIDTKKLIAEKAYELIKNGETIFLDISTTNILLAKLLSEGNKKVTVITNMVDIIKVFRHNPHIKIICPGGLYNEESEGFVGAMTIQNIENYRVDKAFIGSCGVNLYDESITTYDIEDSATKKAIISIAREAYIVMESKKFYIDGVYKFAELPDLKGIITEAPMDEKIVSKLKNYEVELI